MLNILTISVFIVLLEINNNNKKDNNNNNIKFVKNPCSLKSEITNLINYLDTSYRNNE